MPAPPYTPFASTFEFAMAIDSMVPYGPVPMPAWLRLWSPRAMALMFELEMEIDFMLFSLVPKRSLHELPMVGPS